MKLVIGGKAIELDGDVLKKAIEEQQTEISVDVNDIVIRTTEEEQQYVSNIKKEHERVGLEIAVKNAKEKLGIDFQGKGFDTLLEEVQKKALADAKIEPEQKLKDLMADNEKLKSNLIQKETEFESLQNQFGQYKNQSTINSTLAVWFLKN
jgi:predicted  nucleic acid-binding Zn-ribbon protein